MKREATVCGLVFLKFCVLNDKVDIYWIIRNGFCGRPGTVGAARAICQRLRAGRGIHANLRDDVGARIEVVKAIPEGLEYVDPLVWPVLCSKQ